MSLSQRDLIDFKLFIELMKQFGLSEAQITGVLAPHKDACLIVNSHVGVIFGVDEFEILKIRAHFFDLYFYRCPRRTFDTFNANSRFDPKRIDFL
jgi:hypothetical protein